MKFQRHFPLLLGLAGLVLFSACAHGPGRREGGVEFVPAVELRGTGDFFKGLIRATVRLSRADQPRSPKGSASTGGEQGGGRRSGVGGGGGGPGVPGGGGGHRGGGGPGGGAGGPPPGGDSGVASPRIAEGRGPGMVFRIQFTNTSGAPVTFGVWEFNSGLGNFAVRPERFQLEPGTSAEVLPMTTRIGLGGEGLQVALTLRTKAGEERQVITLNTDSLAPGTPPPQGG